MGSAGRGALTGGLRPEEDGGAGATGGVGAAWRRSPVFLSLPSVLRHRCLPSPGAARLTQPAAKPAAPGRRRVGGRKRSPGAGGGRGQSGGRGLAARGQWGGARTAGALRSPLGQVPNLRRAGSRLPIPRPERASLPAQLHPPRSVSTAHAATARDITRARRAPRFLEGRQRGRWEHVPLGKQPFLLPSRSGRGVLHYCYTVHTEASHPCPRSCS